MNSLQGMGKTWLKVCIAVTLTTGFSTISAKAARLGHPAYSAQAATASQRQWNLVCDPTNAESGSTSTQYDPNVAALNTITASPAPAPGFQISHVNVLVGFGEGSHVQQIPGDGEVGSFYFDPGTTSVTFTQVVASLSAAVAVVPPSTYVAVLDDLEGGAVQVFWEPLGTNHNVIGAATPLNSLHICPSPNFGRGGANADVNTHTITFDPAASNTNAFAATFTNYANGDPAFDDIFDDVDGYSGPGFSYFEGQGTPPVHIDPATTTIKLLAPCRGGRGGRDDDHRKPFHRGDKDYGGYGKKH